MDNNYSYSPLGDETLNNENCEDCLPSPSDVEVQTNYSQLNDTDSINTFPIESEVENSTSNDEYNCLNPLNNDEESIKYNIYGDNDPVEYDHNVQDLNESLTHLEYPIDDSNISNNNNNDVNNAHEENNSTKRENDFSSKSKNCKSLPKYGENATCYICKHEYDKNDLSVYCVEKKVDIYNMKYICMSCSVKYVDNIHMLKDWQVDYCSSMKKCYRCNVKRSSKRFKSGSSLCSYCSLKKKYIYLRKKYY